MTALDYEIARKILDDGIGDINLEIEKDNLFITVKGSITITGYLEDDDRCGYGNGTGYFVTTDANINLNFDAMAFDEDDNLLAEKTDIDEDGIREYIYREIIS